MQGIKERMLELDMQQVFEEHRESSSSGLACLRLWILVMSSPILALASADIAGQATFESIKNLFPYLRVFLVFGGGMGLLLIFLHNTKDAARNQCKVGINSIRGVYLGLYEEDFRRKIMLPIDSSHLRNPIRVSFTVFNSFSVLFAFFGGAVCGLYITTGVVLTDLDSFSSWPLLISVPIGVAIASTWHLRAKNRHIFNTLELAIRQTTDD